jgi:hypothetical protein
MRCRATTKAGRQCRAAAIGRTRRCVMHTRGLPERLGAQGGRNRNYRPDDLLVMPAPATAADCRALLAQSLAELRQGKLSPKLAFAVASLAGVFLRATELGDLESRVAALEGRTFRGEQNVRPD